MAANDGDGDPDGPARVGSLSHVLPSWPPGDLFRRRLMQVMEPSLAARKKALQILRQIHLLEPTLFRAGPRDEHPGRARHGSGALCCSTSAIPCSGE